MSSRNAAVPDAVVPFAPKLNGKAETGDTLDKAGQAILGLLNRAASAAEANYRQAVEANRKLSGQLRGAEDRIRELEAKVRHHEDRADRAEKWLYQISVQIEQKFFGIDDRRASQPPAPQAVSQNQPR
jgi:chromosome segregation ATPase